jgi:hypothetical protein
VIARWVELRYLAGQCRDQAEREGRRAEQEQDEQKREEAELPDAPSLPELRTSAKRPQNRAIVTLQSALP